MSSLLDDICLPSAPAKAPGAAFCNAPIHMYPNRLAAFDQTRRANGTAAALPNPRQALANAGGGERKANPNSVRCEMELVLLIAIVFTFGTGGGGKAGW